MLAQNLDKQGSELYLNIFLILIGIACLLYFGIALFKIKNSTISQFQNTTANAEPKLSFVKEKIVTTKFDNEDPNQYWPK